MVAYSMSNISLSVRTDFRTRFLVVLLLLLSGVKGTAQKQQQVKTSLPSVPAGKAVNTASPWVLWYWMEGAVSKEGIRADLIAMKEQGIAGAYLVTVKGAPDSLLVDPPVIQLTPRWWACVKWAFRQADSLGLKLGMHVSDGFATSGGPWIQPEMSMQRVVWKDTTITSQGGMVDMDLPRPRNIRQHYYRDIAVYAFPSLEGTGLGSASLHPVATTNAKGQDARILLDPENTRNFYSKGPCWIQYDFKAPFTCRTIDITTKGVSFQAKRLKVLVSDDGRNFRFLTRLRPARSGWQDYLFPVHYSIAAVTARYFRFVYDPEGTEPGSEDLDDAKWSPSLKLTGLSLGSAPRIPHFEGKAAAVWRVSGRADSALIKQKDCIAPGQLINITDYLTADGHLHWKAPAGHWTILRMGHSSTGAMNATAGGGKGLECDKLNPAAVKIQFEQWFGKTIKKIGPGLANRVLKVFYMDSWECGSQNWSPVFRKAFWEKRGYDLLDYLPVMAGYPIGSAQKSEAVLYDIRLTIAELLNENYFGTLSSLAHQMGFAMTSECTSPIMVSDGLRHFSQVDFPMGEFWWRSPTHDKPNDILDAVSGGHIYGKNIIQAEAFTELRNKWDEYPGMLKPLQDLHYAIGVNRLVFHVFGENPWLNRSPGMTLDGVGLYFQRDQTWWPMVHGWMDYTRRCQQLLQIGKPVTDLAVFNGSEIPSRAILPDRLVATLPGLYGLARLKKEAGRLANIGNPLQHIPSKVTSSAGITTAKDWPDPLHGYKYDALNTDALLRLAKTDQGDLVLSTGARYKILVLPRLGKMDPNNAYMSLKLARKILDLVKKGATLIADRYPKWPTGLMETNEKQPELQAVIQSLLGDEKFYRQHTGKGYKRQVGKGYVLYGPFMDHDFSSLGLKRDFEALDGKGRSAAGIAWTHRQVGVKEAYRLPGGSRPALAGAGRLTDIYFVSNQKDSSRQIHIHVRVSGKLPVLYDAVTGSYHQAHYRSADLSGTYLRVSLPANGSLFVLLFSPDGPGSLAGTGAAVTTPKAVLSKGRVQPIKGKWTLRFDSSLGGPSGPVALKALISWTQSRQKAIQHYSGVATYSTRFNWQPLQKGGGVSGIKKPAVWLELGEVKNIASVRLNGKDCGVAWTDPYRVNIASALRKGQNHLEIRVANTWSNRIMADHQLPVDKRRTWTRAPFNLKGRQALPSGLLGPVKIVVPAAPVTRQ